MKFDFTAFGHMENGIWNWTAANALQIFVVLYFTNAICAVWLAVHSRSLSRQLRRVQRTSEQHGALIDNMREILRKHESQFDAPAAAAGSTDHQARRAVNQAVAQIREEIMSLKAEAAGEAHREFGRVGNDLSVGSVPVSEHGGADGASGGSYGTNPNAT